MSLHCWWFWLVVCMNPLMMTKVWTHTYHIWFPRSQNQHFIWELWGHFSDIWTLNITKLNFIIGRGKIACQKVQHAGQLVPDSFPSAIGKWKIPGPVRNQVSISQLWSPRLMPINFRVLFQDRLSSGALPSYRAYPQHLRHWSVHSVSICHTVWHSMTLHWIV